MAPSFQGIHHRLGRHVLAPVLGELDEKHLMVGQVKPGQRVLWAILLLVAPIGHESLLEASIVGNILAERSHSANGYVFAPNFDTVLVVLANHALRSNYESVDGIWMPPEALIALVVVMAAIVVEAMSYLVTNYGSNATIVE